MKKGDWYKQWV